MYAIELQEVSVRYRVQKVRSLKHLALHGFSRHGRGFFYSLREVTFG